MKKLMMAFAAGGAFCAAWVASALFMRIPAPVAIRVPGDELIVPTMPFYVGNETVLMVVIAGLFATSIGLGIALLRSRRGAELEAGQSNPRLSEARLERIEQAIEAIAVEVERIGEMERSAARILATRPLEGESRPITPRQHPARVITPH